MSTLRCSSHRFRHQPLALHSTVPLRPSRVASTTTRNFSVKTLALAGPAAGKARESKQIVHFKQGEEDVEQELEYLHLDFDCTELLDLHGRDSYLLCDVTKAHDYLLSLPLTEGYSSEVVAGRRQLLDYAKEQVLLQEGRVQQGNKGVDVPVQLLPSALALLAQLNQNTAVADMATKLLDNWDMRKTYKRDLILSLAVVSCNIARDLLTDQKVAEGCSVLEEALVLLQSAGEPPLAPGLAADIQDAVDGFVVQRILDQLRGPMTPEAAPARRKAVQKLKDLLSKGSAPRMQGLLGGGFLASVTQASNAAAGDDSGVAAGGVVTADYIRLVVDCMASHEIVAMANWEQLARHANSTPWLYPGLLQIAATAHIAVGFKERRPATVKAGMALLHAVPASCEVLLLRAVGSVLLGAPEAAVEHIKSAAKAPADAYISWPHDVHATSGTAGPGDEDEEPDLVALTHLPPGPDAYDFLVSHSGPDEPELLSGLCLYTEVFISKVVFAGFPDTSQLTGPTCCLPYYYDSPQVQQQLEEDRGRNASLTGSLSSMMNAVMSVQPLVQQFAESAKSASTQWGLRLRDAGNSADDNSNVSSRKRAVANRLSTDMSGEAYGAYPLEDDQAWEQQQAGLVPAGQQPRGVGAIGNAQALMSQVRGSASAAAQAAAANLAGGVDTVREGLEDKLGSKWPAALAAAALAAVAVGAIVSRRGPATAPQQQQQYIDAAAAATVRALDKNEAAKLVKHFQKAKAAALGSTFDASQLSGVCTGPALEQFQSMSEDWASQGWFRTSNVWKVEIQRVEPRSSSGQRVAVLARIGETSNTWGVDGQQGNSWSNEYDVEYDVVLCSDMQWRIQGLQVRGQEPGAASKGWFGSR